MNISNYSTPGASDDYPTGYIGSSLWIAVLSAIIFVIVSGNLLTISAIFFSRQLSSVMANQFINSLAISDFLVGLYIPYHMYFYMDKSFAEMQFTCILRFIVPIFTCTHSICKLLTIATDRYIAIVYPLHYNRYMTKKVAWALILGGFLIALILSTMPIYWNNWYGGIPCEMEALLPSIYFYFMLMPMFGFACIVMFLVYVKIWMEAYRHARRIRRTTRLPQNVPINDNRSLQVVMLTLGCFSICWMPYFIVTTYFRISGNSSKFSLSYEIAFTLAVCNSGMNPVIYAWKNSNFREAFWCLLTCHSPNNATKKINYITDHVPSKKSSMTNGADGGHDNAAARSDIDVEMDSQNHKDYDEHECSVSTEMSTVNTLSWT